MYTKKEIADSIVKFIANDLMADIDDSHLKFVLCIAKKSLHNNPDVLNTFMNNSLVASVVTEENGCYDIEPLARVMKNVLNEYESYSINIPAIPMFAPKASTIKITAEDVDKVLAYLHGETETAPV